MDHLGKTIGHLFYTTSSFVQHFETIGTLKLGLQSGNAQIGSKLMDDLEKIGHLSYAASSILHHFIAIGEFKLELQSGNAQFG